MVGDATVLFCVMCFANDVDGGSWGGGVVQGHCFNCGAGGSVITMLERECAEIRKNASWVGKRYYACEEDREIQTELKDLRALVTEFPGRTATAYTDEQTGKMYWRVIQRMPNGANVSQTFERIPGEVPADGIEKSRRSMRYVPVTSCVPTNTVNVSGGTGGTGGLGGGGGNG